MIFCFKIKQWEETRMKFKRFRKTACALLSVALVMAGTAGCEKKEAVGGVDGAVDGVTGSAAGAAVGSTGADDGSGRVVYACDERTGSGRRICEIPVYRGNTENFPWRRPAGAKGGVPGRHTKSKSLSGGIVY